MKYLLLLRQDTTEEYYPRGGCETVAWDDFQMNTAGTEEEVVAALADFIGPGVGNQVNLVVSSWPDLLGYAANESRHHPSEKGVDSIHVLDGQNGLGQARLRSRVAGLLAERAEAAKAASEAAAAAAKQVAELEREAAERARYEKLKAKFGGD